MRPTTRSRLLGGAVALTLTVPVGAAMSAPAASAPAPAVSDASSSYLVGSGIYDITGAVAETGAFGYAAQQEMDGLHDRLYSRAYVMGDRATGKRVVFVSADMGAIFKSVKLGVVKKLRERYGDRYTDDNVMLTATHTHVGNGGLSHDSLYQIAAADKSGFGYDKHNLTAVVDGIVESIVRADESAAPGTISLTSGDLTGATKNRSVPAYEANPEAGRYDSDVNTRMTQLKLTGEDGTPRGLVNWFAVHPTSYSKDTTKLSADNKGWAQYHFERRMGSAPTDAAPFVAAFANSDLGDVVPSAGNNHSSPGFEGHPDDEVNVEAAGRPQYDKAVSLWSQPGRTLTGPVDYRARWADFSRYTVDERWTGGDGDTRLCSSARGFSFAAGAENGPSEIPGLREGMTKGSFDPEEASGDFFQSALGALVRGALGGISQVWQDPCHAEKPILLPDGTLGMSPKVLPFQVMRIGDIALVGVPGEITTMAGRRLRATVTKQLEGSGVTEVVIAGLANDYTGYVTTREEYATQHYEGASTEWGPHQLGAFQQEADLLSGAMKEGSSVSDDVTPTSSTIAPTRPGVVFDDKPLGQTFGQVLTEPEASYTSGQTASAVYRGGHPKNDFRTMRSFLEVQRLVDGRWQTVRTDRDWDTTYEWKREGVAYSRTTVSWRIGDDVPAGTYRLVQTGDWKSGWTGKVSPYTGTSRSFTVR